MALLGLAASSQAGNAKDGLLPDLQTVVPTQLQLVNEHLHEVLSFSNGIANRGPGH